MRGAAKLGQHVLHERGSSAPLLRAQHYSNTGRYLLLVVVGVVGVGVVVGGVVVVVVSKGLTTTFKTSLLNGFPAEDERLAETGVGRELVGLLSKAGSGLYSQLSTAPLKLEIGLTYAQYLGYHQHDAHELLIGIVPCLL